MTRYILIVPILGIMVLLLYYTSPRIQPVLPENMVQMDLKDIGVDPASGSPVLILVDREEGKVLPVFIGAAEASAISRGLNREELQRPMTHDLITGIIEATGLKLERIVIVDLKDDVFLCKSHPQRT